MKLIDPGVRQDGPPPRRWWHCVWRCQCCGRAIELEPGDRFPYEWIVVNPSPSGERMVWENVQQVRWRCETCQVTRTWSREGAST